MLDGRKLFFLSLNCVKRGIWEDRRELDRLWITCLVGAAGENGKVARIRNMPLRVAAGWGQPGPRRPAG